MSTPRTILVTGTNGVVGRLVAERFATAGHRVTGLDLTQPETPIDGVRHLAADLADEVAVTAAIDGLRADGTTIEVLVNCAALFGDYHATHRIALETWDRYMQVNARGPFLLMREVLPDMVAAGFGRIVNVASISSVQGGYRQAHYAASKAALIGLSNTVALEYGPRGITSNCVLPGVIDVPRLADAPADVREHALGTVPSRRWAQPDEVAAAVEYLAGDESGYVNGVQLPVDGGSALLQLRFSRELRLGE
ncbi:SDR family oxidoreductase [Nocardioides marmoriginsengisoli]|uniref:SDR family oxidoreductase n=1 Tax=Nocardioides marmoriginsengisoli TaxID=661483 RepID=A0A3N0CPI6_9ACTN|nr:SDR family NAD(P)-dependent oxidoreductase [Nocardioides marmoriginsengisoli]RNL65378.1 SDR family oxidoreductase [Nocardioides marmoriginsengisoli]